MTLAELIKWAEENGIDQSAKIVVFDENGDYDEDTYPDKIESKTEGEHLIYIY